MDKFMKGLYVLWADVDYIERAIDAGINTLLVALYNVRPDVPQNEYFGTYESVVKSLKDFRQYQVKVILVPGWFQEWWGHLTPENQFFDGSRRYEKTPCPVDPFHVDWVMKYPLELFKGKSVDGIFWDFEDYGWDTNPGRMPYYRGPDDEDIKVDLRCRCPRCKEWSEYDQREINAAMIRERLGKAGVLVNGQLPHPNGQLWRSFPEQAWWVNEYTYQKWGVWKRILKHTTRNKVKGKVKAWVSCGAWAEQFTAGDLLTHLNKIGTAAACQGYWIYPQARFSRFSPFHQNPPGQLAYTGLIDDGTDPAGDAAFFSKLKALNQEIDDYRAGWWFEVKKFFAEWFE